MKYPLMFLLFSSLALSGANLLPDGGFELGGRDWTFLRFGDTRKPETLKYLPPAIDSNEKIEGAQSLRFENPHSQFTGIRTPEVKLENDAYTFSFYAKADRPVRIRIMVLSIEDITGEKRKLSWDNRSVRYFQFSASARLPIPNHFLGKIFGRLPLHPLGGWMDSEQTPLVFRIQILG